jgi:hypothetical protein
MGHLTEKIGEKKFNYIYIYIYIIKIKIKNNNNNNKKPTYGLSSPMFSFSLFFTGEISPKIAIAIRI